MRSPNQGNAPRVWQDPEGEGPIDDRVKARDEDSGANEAAQALRAEREARKLFCDVEPLLREAERRGRADGAAHTGPVARAVRRVYTRAYVDTNGELPDRVPEGLLRRAFEIDEATS